MNTTQGKPEASNPANAGPDVAERKRIPMTLPVQRLSAPEIPGYYTYWMRGTPERIAQAERAGFEFVNDSEVSVNDRSLGGDATKSGNTDMGGRVSTLASPTGDGSDSVGGQPLRLYLMKQKWEWHLEDQAVLERRNDNIADTLSAAYKGGIVGGPAEGEQPVDVAQRYVDPRRTRIPDLFKRKNRK